MADEPSGPKRKDRRRQRNKVFTVRLNDAEWTAMQERADRAGLTLGGYFRQAALDTPPLRASRRPSVDRAELAAVLGQAGKIGGNINQLAKLAHLGGWPESEDLRQAIADLRVMRDLLLSALGLTPPGGTGSARDTQSIAT